MPAKVKVRILAGRNLPVMDKSSDASDAFVEVKLGNTTYKTEVYRRSLNPFWNSEWFRFEVSDQELQDEPLQIRIMDYDTYSANDAIGKVYINLNPLLLNPGRSMNGWLPIYDTLHGIRGEINCMVKVNLFADNNRFRHSSCGVRFFFSDIPNGYKCEAVLGFVDELLVNDDPEYQWIDKIRTPRASNEARQTLFTKLSGEVQRKLGLKAEIFGGNAVIGYQQSFDLEGGSGIVGRGIGTAVVLSKLEQSDFLYNCGGGPNCGTLQHSHGNPYQIPQPSAIADRPLSSHYLAQSYRAHAGQSERHLVHSVSADYFYEVPNKVPSETITIAKQALYQSDTSDADTFVSLPSKDDEKKDESETTDEDDSALSIESSSGDEIVLKPPGKLKRHGNLTKSMSLMSASELLRKTRAPSGGSNESSTSKSGRLYIGRYLRHQGREINQRLIGLAKPVAAIATEKSAVKLIKLLSSRNRTTNHQNLSGDATTGSGKKHHYATASDIQNPTSQHQQHKSLSSHSQSSESNTTQPATTTASSTSTGSSAKRRKDKIGQATSSLDDALSIIEEKFDDDADHQQHLQLLHPDRTATSGAGSAQMRARVTSAGNQRLRQITRSREIDLSCDMGEPGELSSPTSSSRVKMQSASSVDDDEDGDNIVAKSSETLSSANLDSTKVQMPSEDKSSLPGESILSTSSPSSTSVLTDETIKAAKEPQKVAGSLEAHIGAPSLLKSETGLAYAASSSKQSSLSRHQEAPQFRSMEAQLVASGGSGGSQQLARSDSARQPPKRSITIGQDITRSNQKRNANFAQSVGVIKAQQQLLQNMIRHQNQNLVVSSMNKARSAQVYPGRIHQSEYPFVTLKRFPDELIQCTGGVVSVHSVKLLDHIINDEESETRDNWWTEIRKEIRSHAKSLNCNTILGYTETSKVLGDVCVLSARGTAAILKPLEQMISAPNLDIMRERASSGSNQYHHHHHHNHNHNPHQQQVLKVPRLSSSPQPHSSHASMPPQGPAHAPSPSFARNREDQSATRADNTHQASTVGSATTAPLIDCSFCHTPLHCVESIASLADCSICCSNKVPDVLLLTIEPPKSLNIVSTCSLVQARVCRAKRDLHGEASAKEIGEALPFLEYELHRQLFSKLKFKGMNCLFNLEIDISVGENFITGLATGTGCFVLGLPAPEAPMISAGKGIKANKLNEIQRLIALSASRNRDLLGLNNITLQLEEYHKQIGILDKSPSPVPAEHDESTAVQSQTILQFSNSLETTSTECATSSALASSTPTPLVDSEKSKKLAATALQQSTSYQNKHKHHYGHHHHYHGHHHHHNHHHHHHHHHHRKSPRLTGRYSSTGQASDGGGGGLPQPTENLVNMLNDENNIVLEVDDNEDADIIALLIDSDIPHGYMICNSEIVPTIRQEKISSINMFTQVMRVKLNSSEQFAQQFDLVLQTLYVKLRRSLPCCLTNLNFVVDLPESNVVQITLTGCLLGLNYGHDQLDNGRQTSSRTSSQQGNILDGDQTINSVGSAPARIEGGRRSETATRHTKKSKKAAPKPASSTSMSPNSTSAADSTSPSGNSHSTSSSVSSESSASSSDKASSSTSSTSSSSDSPTSSSSSNNSTVSLDANSKKKSTTAVAVASTSKQPTPTASEGAATKKKPPGKSSSGSNLAALISAGKSTFNGVRKSRSKNTGIDIEMTEPKVEAKSPGTPTTKSTIAAVKQEILLNKLGRPGQESITKKTARKLRPVFKKQQTYPGANSPAIGGQDDVLAKQQQQLQALNELIPNTESPSQSGSSIARKQATALLNKVKQPFKDLGSNFNSFSPGLAHQMDFLGQRPMPRSSSMEMNPISAGQERAATKHSGSRSGTGLVSRASMVEPVSGHPARLVDTPNSTPNSTPNRPATPGTSANQRRLSLNTATGPAGAQYLSGAAAAIERHSKPSSLNSSIDITSLSYIPGAKDYHYLGNLSFSFVRETNSVRENGGLNGFIHCFLMEVYAIVRAHVSALGGNAFLSFRLQQSCIFYHSNKNQAQCLISVAGDAVQVTH